MPEISEVKAYCSLLQNTILKRKILKVDVFTKKLRYKIPNNIHHEVFQNKIKWVLTRGKYIILLLNKNKILVFHLGMTGSLIISNNRYRRKKHDHLVISFNNNIKLIFNDIRKFGYIELATKPFDIINYKQLGKEPLSTMLFKEDLFLKINKTKQNLKNILLNQKFISGIGNIFANEILFRASISPYKLGSQINNQEFNKLLTSINCTLSLAIKRGLKSIENNKKNANTLLYFKKEMKVYNRENQECYKCNNLIKKKIQSGRSSYYCTECQS